MIKKDRLYAYNILHPSSFAKKCHSSYSFILLISYLHKQERKKEIAKHAKIKDVNLFLSNAVVEAAWISFCEIDQEKKAEHVRNLSVL